MEPKRRWGLIGLLAGVVMGLGDMALFAFLGVEMRIGGRDVVLGVMGLFIATYGVLGPEAWHELRDDTAWLLAIYGVAYAATRGGNRK